MTWNLVFHSKWGRSSTSIFSADTQTGTIGRRLSNHNVFWKQKIVKFSLFFFFFANRPTKFKVQLATVENSKTVLSCQPRPLRKERSNVIGPFAKQKTKKKRGRENLLFSLTLWLANLLASDPVWVSALWVHSPSYILSIQLVIILNVF